MDPSADHPDPNVHHEFGHDSAASRSARRAIEPLLPDDAEIAGDIATAASELVANVVLHTDGGGVLDAWTGYPFRIEVSDDNPDIPTIGESENMDGGNGLRIVDSTSDRWGIEQHPDDGKTVWAEFDERRQGRNHDS